MSEWRIPDVVCQTSCLDDLAKVLWQNCSREPLLTFESVTDRRSKGATNACDFQAMGEPVVYVIVGRKRVHLRLVREPPKRAGEDHLVLIGCEC
jgi:hypothetical protein